MDNEKKEELVETTENIEKKETEPKEEQPINESKEIEQVVEDEKKEEPKTEPQINNRSSNDLRPRKWLLGILVVITIAIVGVLVYKTVLGISSALSNSSGSWGIFNLFKGNDTIEKETNNIFSKTKNEINKQMAEEFNWDYETSMGKQTGDDIYSLLDKVIINNKKNNDKIITVVFKEITTNDPTKIKEIKRSLDEIYEYEVSLDYNNQGYVNKITIEE